MITPCERQILEGLAARLERIAPPDCVQPLARRWLEEGRTLRAVLNRRRPKTDERRVVPTKESP